MQMAEQTAEPMTAIDDTSEKIPPNTNTLYNTNKKQKSKLRFAGCPTTTEELQS